MTSISARAQAPAFALEKFNKSLKRQALETSIYSLISSVPTFEAPYTPRPPRTS